MPTSRTSRPGSPTTELTVPISFAALALAATPFAPLDPAAAAPRTAITWRTRLGALAFVVAATA